MSFFLLGVAGAAGADGRARRVLAGAGRDHQAVRLWVAAIGGLLLAVLLLFTGRGLAALAALVLLGPLLWSWVGQGRRAPRGARAAGAPGAPAPPRGDDDPRRGLSGAGPAPGASEAEIRAAHRRLMRAAHPDAGGSDWLAARINQARDVLLG